MSAKRFSTSCLLPLVFTLATIFFYFNYLSQHAINVPLADDIYDIIKPLSDALAAPAPDSALQALYSQHTDHRTTASRLIYVGIYLATGELNFRSLNFISNLALPLLLLALFVMASRHPRRCLIILPAALLLFQLRAYGITFWSMAAFAYFYVFLYGFYAVINLHRVTPVKFITAIVLATLATFTLASGQLIWLVGLASLLHQSLLRKSAPHYYSLAWVICAAVTLAVWRIDLDARLGMEAMLQNFITSPGHHVLYTLTLLGSAASESSVGIAALTGATLLITLVVVSMYSYREADQRLELCCWFVVISVMAIVIGRSFASVDYALSSRYSFPSILLMATTWVLLAVRLQLCSWKILLPITLLAFIYCTTSYGVYSAALQPYMEKRVQDFNRGNYRAWPHPPKNNKRIVKRAIAQGIYTPPEAPLPPARVVLPADKGRQVQP